jgi:hypothetical protein
MVKYKKGNVWVAEKDKALFTEQFDDWDITWGYEWNTKIYPYYQGLKRIANERSFVIFAAIILETEVDKFLKSFIPEPQLLLNDNTPIQFKLGNYIPVYTSRQ